MNYAGGVTTQWECRTVADVIGVLSAMPRDMELLVDGHGLCLVELFIPSQQHYVLRDNADPKLLARIAITGVPEETSFYEEDS